MVKQIKSATIASSAVVNEVEERSTDTDFSKVKDRRSEANLAGLSKEYGMSVYMAIIEHVCRDVVEKDDIPKAQLVVLHRILQKEYRIAEKEAKKRKSPYIAFLGALITQLDIRIGGVAKEREAFESWALPMIREAKNRNVLKPQRDVMITRISAILDNMDDGQARLQWLQSIRDSFVPSCVFSKTKDGKVDVYMVYEFLIRQQRTAIQLMPKSARAAAEADLENKLRKAKKAFLASQV